MQKCLNIESELRADVARNDVFSKINAERGKSNGKSRANV